MMNCAIVCAREKFKVILKNYLFDILRIASCPTYINFKVRKGNDLPNGNGDPGASQLKPRVRTFIHHPPENLNNIFQPQNHKIRLRLRF